MQTGCLLHFKMRIFLGERIAQACSIRQACARSATIACPNIGQTIGAKFDNMIGKTALTSCQPHHLGHWPSTWRGCPPRHEHLRRPDLYAKASPSIVRNGAHPSASHVSSDGAECCSPLISVVGSARTQAGSVAMNVHPHQVEPYRVCISVHRQHEIKERGNHLRCKLCEFSSARPIGHYVRMNQPGLQSLADKRHIHPPNVVRNPAPLRKAGANTSSRRGLPFERLNYRLVLRSEVREVASQKSKVGLRVHPFDTGCFDWLSQSSGTVSKFCNGNTKRQCHALLPITSTRQLL